MAKLPRAPSTSDWDLDPKFVLQVTHEIEHQGWEATMEVVELAMLAAETWLNREAAAK